ncbi:ABC transporter permease [Balneatrix alpica]|uniref:ABC transporter permease n=1 Tax=Balneatrix alpica TaxID=75684 RepID=UPI0027383350|nr:ABC transporter permease [Balneatrix alpica]
MDTSLTLAESPAEEKAAQRQQLKQRLKRSQRRQQLKALALVAPLFLFTLLVFLLPIALLLQKAVENPELQRAWPQVSETISDWDGQRLPEASLFLLLEQDIRRSYNDKSLSEAAKRLNTLDAGLRSMIMRTGRQFNRLAPASSAEQAKQRLLDQDQRWGELSTWQAIAEASSPYTSQYLLAALDLQQNSQGEIVAASADQAIYLNIYARTLWMAFIVTLISLLLGFPLAYWLATSPAKQANLLMIGVLLPFWTSLLVRTSAWVVLLQKEGLLNSLLLSLGWVNEPLTLLFNRPGVYLALVHILLPFMVLSLYSVMKAIPPYYMRAALSLGARPSIAFIRIYLPQTLPGVASGFLLCFIMAVGYYITPALIGSPQDQMISYFIAYYTNQTINWGMASALGVFLLLASVLLFVLYSRLAAPQRQLG